MNFHAKILQLELTECGLVVITSKKMHVLTMQAVDNGDHFVIVEGSEYTTASHYTKQKKNSSLRKIAGIKAIHSLATIKMIEQEQIQGK